MELNQAVYERDKAVEERTKAENNLERLRTAVLKIDHAPGYDWNADPLNLTLLIGMVHEMGK